MFYSVGRCVESSFCLREWHVQPTSMYRRSATLRTYAGDTSLPGGKWDPEDRNPEETAVRAPLSVFNLFFMFSYRSAGRLLKKYIYLIPSEQHKR
jgi:hypothetical protein